MTAFYINLAIGGLVQGLIIALAALAINLVFAVGRFANAATGDYVTVGAYAGIAAQAVGFTSTLAQGLAAALVTAVLVPAVYLLVFRPLAGRPAATFMIASVGVGFFLRYTIAFFVGHDQYTFLRPTVRALQWEGIRMLPIDLWLSGLAVLAVAAVFCILFLTSAGRRLRAVADNPELARTSGIDVGNSMMLLWVLVGFLSGVGGMIVGIKTVVVPDIGWNILLPAFAAAILGGVGNLPGALIAGLLLGVVQELSSPIVGFVYKQAIAFGVLVLVLAVRPQGLFGARKAVR